MGICNPQNIAITMNLPNWRMAAKTVTSILRASSVVVVVISVFLLQFPRPVVSSANAPSVPAQILGVSHGAHIRPTVNYGTEIGAFNTLVQKKIAVVMYFLGWSAQLGDGTYSVFNPFLANQIQSQLPPPDRPVIMLTWEPIWGRRGLGCDQDYSGVIPPDNIIQGKCDALIRSFAQTLKARPERFLLRFAHEMNIPNSAWWPGHFGQTSSTYVAMWQHVHDVFATQQVGNVEWVWSPNYASNPPPTVSDYAWNDLHNYYPGDRYVDWIALSGFNWYTVQSQPWRSFSDLYDGVLNDLTCQYPKPQIIGEIGSVDGGSPSTSKANWITDVYQRVPNYPFVRSVVWFNDYAFEDPNNADFRVTTGTAQSGGVNQLPTGSGTWTQAYEQGVANSVYATSLPSLSQATPPLAYCGAGQPVFSLTPNSAVVIRGKNSSYHLLTGLVYPDTLNLSLILPNGHFSGSITPSQLQPPWGQASIQLWIDSMTPSGIYQVTVHIVGAGGTTSDQVIRVVVGTQAVYLPLVIR